MVLRRLFRRQSRDPEALLGNGDRELGDEEGRDKADHEHDRQIFQHRLPVHLRDGLEGKESAGDGSFDLRIRENVDAREHHGREQIEDQRRNGIFKKHVRQRLRLEAQLLSQREGPVGQREDHAADGDRKERGPPVLDPERDRKGQMIHEDRRRGHHKGNTDRDHWRHDHTEMILVEVHTASSSNEMKNNRAAIVSFGIILMCDPCIHCTDSTKFRQ